MVVGWGEGWLAGWLAAVPSNLPATPLLTPRPVFPHPRLPGALQGLTQNTEEYENKAAHVELAKKMKKRDPATAPTVGDRVPYVIVKAAKGAKGYEKAEDPIYALRNNLPIDCQHYLDHHLAQPLMRLFEPIMKNPKELLTGGCGWAHGWGGE